MICMPSCEETSAKPPKKQAARAPDPPFLMKASMMLGDRSQLTLSAAVIGRESPRRSLLCFRPPVRRPQKLFLVREDDDSCRRAEDPKEDDRKLGIDERDLSRELGAGPVRQASDGCDSTPGSANIGCIISNYCSILEVCRISMALEYRVMPCSIAQASRDPVGASLTFV